MFEKSTDGELKFLLQACEVTMNRLRQEADEIERARSNYAELSRSINLEIERRAVAQK